MGQSSPASLPARPALGRDTARRFVDCDGVYKISDVIIDDLSMAANGRTQLEGVVQRNGRRPQAILAVMRQQTANAAAR